MERVRLKLDKLLILDDSTIEYSYDNIDIIYDLKEIVQILNQVNEKVFWEKKDNNNEGIQIWTQNFYQYTREAYNNLIVGNLYSFYSGIRTFLENRIYFEYIPELFTLT